MKNNHLGNILLQIAEKIHSKNEKVLVVEIS
jgi:hypothetical protein